MIGVSNASVAFGGVKALDDVSISCDAGTIVGIVGPNGSGKSALFDAISGRCRLAGGSISVNGSAIAGLRPHLIARLGLARTYEEDRLFGRMTAFENVLCGAHLRDGTDASRRAEVSAVLDALSLKGRARSFVSELEPGERRRVALARALVSRARSLLVEEPFLSLDENERETVRAALVGAAKAAGSAVIVSARDVSSCEGICDDVLVLHAGKAIAHGPFDTVVRDIDVRDAYLGVEWRQ